MSVNLWFTDHAFTSPRDLQIMKLTCGLNLLFVNNEVIPCAGKSIIYKLVVLISRSANEYNGREGLLV